MGTAHMAGSISPVIRDKSGLLFVDCLPSGMFDDGVDDPCGRPSKSCKRKLLSGADDSVAIAHTNNNPRLYCSK